MARDADEGTPSEIDSKAASPDDQWRRFQRQWSPMLHAYLSRLRSTRRERDELVWDALVSAFERCGWSDGDAGAADAVRAAARDLARRWRTVARHETAIGEGEAIPDASALDPLQRAEHEAMRAQLEWLLSRLPERQREAIERHILDGVADAEIGAELACRPGNVKVQRHRGLRALQRLVLESPPPVLAILTECVDKGCRGITVGECGPGLAQEYQGFGTGAATPDGSDL